MKINRAAIKTNAKSILSSSKPSPILVVLANLGIILVLNFLSGTVSGDFQIYVAEIKMLAADNFSMNNAQEVTDMVSSMSANMNHSPWGTMLVIAMDILSFILNAGLLIYCLNICQLRKGDFGNLFDGFGLFFKVLWLNIVMMVFVWLWSLLLIIPGIIAFYRYRMALYILLENPQLSALDCITASRQMMTGHKGELFVLDLSFLGWAILAMVPFAIIWVAPYFVVTQTNYYLALRDMPKPGFERVI